jgi:hypothetical protein
MAGFLLLLDNFVMSTVGGFYSFSCPSLGLATHLGLVEHSLFSERSSSGRNTLRTLDFGLIVL